MKHLLFLSIAASLIQDYIKIRHYELLQLRNMLSVILRLKSSFLKIIKADMQVLTQVC